MKRMSMLLIVLLLVQFLFLPSSSYAEIQNLVKEELTEQQKHNEPELNELIVEEEVEIPSIEENLEGVKEEEALNEEPVPKEQESKNEATKDETGNGKDETLPSVEENIINEEVDKQQEEQLVPALFAPSKSILLSTPQWPAPGSLSIDKKAKPTSNYGEWEIELAVKGKNLKTTSDIVLVFDNSRSMEIGLNNKRLAKAKEAAQAFVTALLVDGRENRIALVEFSEYANTKVDFTKNSTRLNEAINGIDVVGGTNIQAGLKQARDLLSKSNADMKTIVLLSDGAPTYSYKARNASTYNDWLENKYKHILSDFNYNVRVGNGASYEIMKNAWPRPVSDYYYTNNRVLVKTHGLATISEAKHTMDQGIGIYSVALDVGDDEDATYVLKTSQNKGMYEADPDKLTEIFDKIASSLLYAASDASVKDPMGEMFDLVQKGDYTNGANFEASEGKVSWDSSTETFDWQIGSIDENKTYTLKYKVQIDCTKNIKGNTLYPTNGITTLQYNDLNNSEKQKNFTVPQVKIESGNLSQIGYRVNLEGQPIDENGNVVSSYKEAQQFYNEKIAENIAFGTEYEVKAKEIEGFVLHQGDPSIKVVLSTEQVCETVLFGYVKEEELIAGELQVRHVDEQGNDIAAVERSEGKINEKYETSQREIAGYTFKEVRADSAPTAGQYKKEAQTVIYVYTKQLGSLTILKKSPANEPLKGAVFVLIDNLGQEMNGTTDDEGKLVFDNLQWGEYTLREVSAPEGQQLLTEELQVTIAKEDLHVTKSIINQPQNYLLPDSGGIGATIFYGLGGLLIIIACWGLIRKKKRPIQ